MRDDEIDESVYLNAAFDALEMLDAEEPLSPLYWEIFETLARMALGRRRPYQSELEKLQTAFLNAVNAQADEEGRRGRQE